MGNDIKPDNQPIHTGNDARINDNQPTIPNVRGDNTSGIGSTPKRGRGRPRGSKNKPKQSTYSNGLGRDNQASSGEYATNETTGTIDINQTPILVQEQKGKKRGRKQIVKQIENPGETAETVINTIELAAIQFIGEEARLEPFERFLIEIGATDTISKVSPEQAAKVAAIISPICLIGGLALYGFRMASVVSDKIKQNKQVELKQSDSEFVQEAHIQEHPNGFNIMDTIVPPVSKLNSLGDN